ncbi:hypothetical protein [Mycobacterium kiyosense]|uniref:hypothetical protein n=1 Tax=Mycobacterium kiyosense TaxID=2871094 RepID=UPI002230E8BD|nr:hypothetical protein [Mycobacterium kiyosense]
MVIDHVGSSTRDLITILGVAWTDRQRDKVTNGQGLWSRRIKTRAVGHAAILAAAREVFAEPAVADDVDEQGDLLGALLIGETFSRHGRRETRRYVTRRADRDAGMASCDQIVSNCGTR